MVRCTCQAPSSVRYWLLADLKTLRLEETHIVLVYPLSLRISIVISLYFCSRLSITHCLSIERITYSSIIYFFTDSHVRDAFNIG